MGRGKVVLIGFVWKAHFKYDYNFAINWNPSTVFLKLVKVPNVSKISSSLFFQILVSFLRQYTALNSSRILVIYKAASYL